MHVDISTLEAGLAEVRRSPRDDGPVKLIVRRPATDERETPTEANLDLTAGLVGDKWADESADPERQVTVINSRAIALVAGTPERWKLAGDQLYIDLDLSTENLPPGTRLEIGSAILEVTPAPHRGCKAFAARFGLDALRFVNSETGYALKLRGINTRVIRAGTIRVGDTVRKATASTR